MMGAEQPNAGRAPVRWVLFVLSAAVAALALRVTWREPLAGVVLLVALLVTVGVRLLGRARQRRLLRSGDLSAILSGWAATLDHLPYPRTMRPLMTATALAAHGWVESARAVLRTAERGPAWDAAVEHRLFVDVLLASFDGERHRALEAAGELARLPRVGSGSSLARRVGLMREAAGALARAFAHRGLPGDGPLLLAAGRASPLVHWAMRYGAAVAAVDSGRLGQAQALLANAPSWPPASRFAGFDAELHAELARRRAVPTN